MENRKKMAIGKCVCKNVIAVELEQSFRLFGKNEFGREIWKHARYTCSTKELLCAGFYKEGVSVRCSCGKNVWLKIVAGVKNETPCDGRCTGARGHVCECSCGGANHGRNHM